MRKLLLFLRVPSSKIIIFNRWVKANGKELLKTLLLIFTRIPKEVGAVDDKAPDTVFIFVLLISLKIS